MSYDKEQEVYGWFRYSFGDGEVESFCCVPDSAGQEWQLWLIVKRTVNGSTVRYIEVLGNEFNPTSATDKDEMRYVDSWIEVSAASKTLSGLDHLEGEEVDVVIDGAYDSTSTVASGSVTTMRTGTTALVGLPYTSTIKTIYYEGGNPRGTSQSKTKTIPKISVRLLNSLGFKFGQTEARLRLVSFRSTGDVMESSPELFTGDKEVYSGGSYDGDGSFYLVQDQPYPLNILAIMPEMDTKG
jgi:hypothetical protein